MSRKQMALFEPSLVRQALMDAVKKLSPRVQWHNPVMFIVWIGSLLTTALAIAMGTGHLQGNAMFTGAISLWLWFTVLFANFAEALAEGRSKAQANSLKGVKRPLLRANYANRNTVPRWTMSRQMNCVKVTWCWSKPGTLSPATVKSSKAARR
ncbi:potassium-transporting ATPase subunit B [Enterobacter ludwigii]|nr:potassium-transporting ATPase subunit B [Enterobacter ludwigii]